MIFGLAYCLGETRDRIIGQRYPRLPGSEVNGVEQSNTNRTSPLERKTACLLLRGSKRFESAVARFLGVGLLRACHPDSTLPEVEYGSSPLPPTTLTEYSRSISASRNTVHFSILTVLGLVLRDDVLERSLGG